MIGRIAVVVGLTVASWLAPTDAGAGWSGTTTPGALGRAATTTLQPVDSALTATCLVGALGLSLSIRLTWTDTPQPWVDGYEWRQRIGANAYPASGTSVALVAAAPQVHTVDVPIDTAGSYQFAVRSKGRAWRSADVESPTMTVTKTLGLYSCS